MNIIKTLYKPMYKVSIKSHEIDAIKQLPVNLNINFLIKSFSKFGFNFAIRTYRPDRIKGPIYSICFEDWLIIENLSKNNMFPQLKSNKTIPNIYKEFRNYLMKIS